MTQTEWESVLLKKKVSTWPRPNSSRQDIRLRWPISEPFASPRATRYVFQATPHGGPETLYGVIDMAHSGDMKMEGETGPNVDGRNVHLIVEGFEPDDEGPEGVPGMYLTFTWTRPDFITRTGRYWSPLPYDDDTFHPMTPTQTTHLTPGPTKWNQVTEIFDEDMDFDAFWFTNFGWHTVSECNLEIPGEPEVPELSAEFNGVDAYIELTDTMTNYGGPWFFEANIRLRDDEWSPCLCPQSSNSNIGILAEQATYSAGRLDLDDLPDLGVWFKLRLEFEWSRGNQLEFAAWIDDDLQDFSVVNRVFLPIANLGVRNLGAGGTFGDFDMKNLLYKQGSFASPITKLDMPLTVNALDLGPDENHGIPFNMDLPAS